MASKSEVMNELQKMQEKLDVIIEEIDYINRAVFDRCDRYDDEIEYR